MFEIAGGVILGVIGLVVLWVILLFLLDAAIAFLEWLNSRLK